MITKNVSPENQTITLGINGSNQVFNLEDYNQDLKVLVEAYNTDGSDANMAAILAKIEVLEEINRAEYILNGEVKRYINKNQYFFSDDDEDQFELDESVVFDLELIDEAQADVKPIINFLKNLRKSPSYSADFSRIATDVIQSTFVNGKIYNKFINKGFYTEVAYIQSNENKFTLTSDGLVVAYKRADIKDYKFDKETGERIDRYAFSFDEETGEKLVVYPNNAEDFKIFLESKTINRLETRKETNKYITVGGISDQRLGKKGFEEDGQSLIFKGSPVTDSENYVKVLIHPQFITNFGGKFSSITTPVFYVTEFVRNSKVVPTSAVINPKDFYKYAVADWKERSAKAKAELKVEQAKQIKIVEAVSKI